MRFLISVLYLCPKIFIYFIIIPLLIDLLKCGKSGYIEYLTECRSTMTFLTKANFHVKQCLKRIYCTFSLSNIKH